MSEGSNDRSVVSSSDTVLVTGTLRVVPSVGGVPAAFEGTTLTDRFGRLESGGPNDTDGEGFLDFRETEDDGEGTATRTRRSFMGAAVGSAGVSATLLSGRSTAETTSKHSWKVYGIDSSEMANTISLDEGGDIYLYGTSHRRNQAVSHDIIGLKTDRRGRVIWDRRPRSEGTEVILDSTAVADGTVVVGFDSYPSDGEYHFVVEKWGPEGTVKWRRDFGPGTARRVVPGHGGGLVTVGTREGDAGTDPRPVIVRLRDDGSTLWTQRLPLPAETVTSALTRTTDGGYLVGGSPDIDGTEGSVAKTDASGRTDWHQRYTLGPAAQVRSVVESGPGEFVLAVNTLVDTQWRSSIVKIDADGRQIRRTRIGGSGNDMSWAVLTGEAGTCWVCGSTTSFAERGRDAFLLELHQNGDIASRVTVGGSGSERAADMVRSPDGGFLLAGWSTSTPWPGSDAWLAKIGGRDRLADPASDSEVTFPLLAGSAVALGGAALLGLRYLRDSTG